MTDQLYALEVNGVWHAIDPLYGVLTLGRCGHKFMAVGPEMHKCPHPDKYCAGCKGVEEREAKQAEVKS